jgi:hypothetical protein
MPKVIRKVPYNSPFFVKGFISRLKKRAGMCVTRELFASTWTFTGGVSPSSKTLSGSSGLTTAHLNWSQVTILGLLFFISTSFIFASPKYFPCPVYTPKPLTCTGMERSFN